MPSRRFVAVPTLPRKDQAPRVADLPAVWGGAGACPQKRCRCRSRLRAPSRLRSAVAYEGAIELAVGRFKYLGWRRLAAPLALLPAERLVVEGLAGSRTL